MDQQMGWKTSAYNQTLALNFFSRLLKNIDPRRGSGTEVSTSTLLAYFEESGNFTAFPRTDFPIHRKNYNGRINTFQKRKQPHLIRLIDLREEEKALAAKKFDDADRAGKQENTEKRLEVSQEIAGITEEVATIDRHKPKPYQAYYRYKYRRVNGVAKHIYPKIREKDVDDLQQYFDRSAKKISQYQPDPTHKNLTALGDMFDWSPLYRDILEFCWIYDQVLEVKDFVERDLLGKGLVKGSEGRKNFNHVLSVALGVSREEISQALSVESELIKSGILSLSKTGLAPVLNETLVKILGEPDITREKLESRLFGNTPRETGLNIDDHFSSMAAETKRFGDFVLNMKDNDKGCHVLVWGIQDSGKTSYVLSLADKLGLRPIVLGEGQKDKDGKQRNLTPEERVQDVLFGFHVTSGMKDVLRVIDDAEIILNITKPGENDNKSLSKAMVLRMLESGDAVWIVNDVTQIDPSVRRRFKHNIQFKPQGTPERIQSFQRAVETSGLPVAAKDVEDLARRYRLPVGSMITAIDYARKTTKDAAALEHSLTATARLVFNGVTNVMTHESAPRPYYPELANFKELKTGASPETFMKHAENFVREDLRYPVIAVSHGPAGSGKSSLWEHVAYRNNARVIELNFLDLFQDADEVHDRLVNEAIGKKAVILWKDADMIFHPDMPRNPDVMKQIQNGVKKICDLAPAVHVFMADRLPNALKSDPKAEKKENVPFWFSSLCTFEMKYSYMEPVQIKKAFEFFFEQDCPPKAAQGLYRTPGLFANTAWRLRAFKDTISAKEIGSTLESEALGMVEESKQDTVPEFVPPTLKH